MNLSFGGPNDLQPPGAGIPAFERFALNAGLKTAAALMTDKFVLRRIQSDAKVILDMAECESQSYDVTDPIVTPRVIGIEDSSRNWSVLMVLEHLCLVNTELTKLVAALVDGIVPKGEIDIALYKPSDEIGYDVIPRFENVTNDYAIMVTGLINKHGNLNLPARYPHPWFGSLNAHQWHCLVAAHQKIHRRQLQKIIAMLGVA